DYDLDVEEDRLSTRIDNEVKKYEEVHEHI
ncbi:MAG: hypothetical protein SCARUB_05195, partial [Candidatus Scalindua rubra]